MPHTGQTINTRRPHLSLSDSHMPKAKNDYTVVKIPKELANEIDGLLGKFGFRTRAELVKEAVRALLQKYAGLMPKAGD